VLNRTDRLRLGVDLTACWRPRVGMVTLAVELARGMLEAADLVLFASGARPPGLEQAKAEFVLSPHRHELWNKLSWLPRVEGRCGLDAMFYPYWPSPPRRSAAAPPCAIFVHDLAFRIQSEAVPWQQRLYLGKLLTPALRAAAVVMTPSHTTRQDLLEHFPLPGLERRVEVIYPGCSLTAVAARGVAPELGRGFILAVGSIERRKNYRRLIEAYRRLKSPPPLVVVGRSGWGSSRLRRELELEPGVKLLGHVDDATLRGLYQSAALLVFPSLYEGFGLPLLEAMAEGLPAVVSDAGSLAEVAGGAALLVDPLDPLSLADGMERVLSDRQLAARMTEAGRARAAEFDWQSASRRAFALLERLAAGRAA